MDLGIAGKVALVTGASRGVGRAIAASLLREGARVMITARDAKRLDATRAALAQETNGDVRKERVAHIALGRMGEPEEVADVVAFLASARSRYVTGAGWHVDGGAYGGI